MKGNISEQISLKVTLLWKCSTRDFFPFPVSWVHCVVWKNTAIAVVDACNIYFLSNFIYKYTIWWCVLTKNIDFVEVAFQQSRPCTGLEVCHHYLLVTMENTYSTTYIAWQHISTVGSIFVITILTLKPLSEDVCRRFSFVWLYSFSLVHICRFILLYVI